MIATLAADSEPGQKRQAKPNPEPSSTPRQYRRYEVLNVILDIAERYNGSLPNVRGQWLLFMIEARKRAYAPMKLTTFRGHIRQLVKEKLIFKENGVIYIPKSTWRPPKNLRQLLN